MARRFAIALMRCLIALSILAPLATGAPAQATQGARVVIVDASGTMRNKSYPGGGTRWDELMKLAERYFDALPGTGDSLPTELMIFGARTSFTAALRAERRKPVSQQRFSHSTEYPPDGPLCADMDFITARFSQAGPGSFDALRGYVQALPGKRPVGGMTPQGPAIRLALERVLDRFGADTSVEIVILSDFDIRNCALPGQSVCDQIAPSLRILQEGGGSAMIRVLEIPNSDLSLELSDCVTTGGVKHVSGAEIDDTIARFLAPAAVSALARTDQAGLLYPGKVDLSGMTFRARIAGTTQVAAGGAAGAPILLTPGPYDFELTDGTSVWTATGTVTGDREVIFDIAPGRIEVTADRDGQPQPRLDALRIAPRGQPGSGPAGPTPLAARFSLLPGSYTLTGVLGSEQRQLPVIVRSGQTTPVALGFSAAPVSAIAVTVDVRIVAPTLAAGAYALPPYAPEVLLHGPGQSSARALSPGPNALTLVPGQYRIEVGPPRTRHTLHFDVPPASAPIAVALSVAAGWFAADAPVSGGSFELQDAAGTPLVALTGDRVWQSLPDGSYILQFTTPDKAVSRAAFAVSTGDITQVDIP